MESVFTYDVYRPASFVHRDCQNAFVRGTIDLEVNDVRNAKSDSTN